MSSNFAVQSESRGLGSESSQSSSRSVCSSLCRGAVLGFSSEARYSGIFSVRSSDAVARLCERWLWICTGKRETSALRRLQVMEKSGADIKARTSEAEGKNM